MRDHFERVVVGGVCLLVLLLLLLLCGTATYVLWSWHPLALLLPPGFILGSWLIGYLIEIAVDRDWFWRR